MLQVVKQWLKIKSGDQMIKDDKKLYSGLMLPVWTKGYKLHND